MTQRTKLFSLSLTVALMCRVVTAADHTITDITTSEGKAYKDATVNRAEPDGLLLTYRPEEGGIGMAKVKFAVLPEKLQQEYGYDVQKAVAFESDQARGQGALRAKFLIEHQDATKRIAKRLADEEAKALLDQWAAATEREAQTDPAHRGGGENLAYAQTPGAIADTTIGSGPGPGTTIENVPGNRAPPSFTPPENRLLGTLNGNRYDPNSLANPYGAGNPYKPDGLKNPYSQYGNPYSIKSPNNPYATDTPKLYQNGIYQGKLSTNPYDPDSISNPWGRYGPHSGSIKNPYTVIEVVAPK